MNDGNAKNIIIVGARRMGKSTMIEGMIRHVRNVVVYDPNSEYGTVGYWDEDINVFLDMANDIDNHMIVLEDATEFFPTKGRNKRAMSMLTRNRHRNNMIILVFHSLADIPIYIVNKVDSIILFHTKDLESSVKSKFSGNVDIINAYLFMQERNLPGENIVIHI